MPGWVGHMDWIGLLLFCVGGYLGCYVCLFGPLGWEGGRRGQIIALPKYFVLTGFWLDGSCPKKVRTILAGNL